MPARIRASCTPVSHRAAASSWSRPSSRARVRCSGASRRTRARSGCRTGPSRPVARGRRGRPAARGHLRGGVPRARPAHVSSRRYLTGRLDRRVVPSSRAAARPQRRRRGYRLVMFTRVRGRRAARRARGSRTPDGARVLSELQGRRPRQQRPERSLQLHPGERRPDAEVHPGAEGDVRALVRPTSRVSGVGEHGGVAVGRASRAAIFWPAPTVMPPISTSSVAVRSNSCSGESKRMSSSIAVGAGPGSRAGAQLGRGAASSATQPVPAHVDGGLVAGVEQQDAGRDQLVLVSRSPLGVAALTRWVSRSSPGCFRRSAARSRR